MSDGELARLEVLRDLAQRRLTTETTAQLLGLERHQVFRPLKAYRSEGATGLISKRRGHIAIGASPRRCGERCWRSFASGLGVSVPTPPSPGQAVGGREAAS